MSSGITAGNLFAAALQSFVFDPASVAANTTVEQTVTVRGLSLNDLVMVAKPTVTAGLFISSARVSAANTLAITLGNCTASPIDAASETWMLLHLRPESGQLRVAGQTL